MSRCGLSPPPVCDLRTSGVFRSGPMPPCAVRLLAFRYKSLIFSGLLGEGFSLGSGMTLARYVLSDMVDYDVCSFELQVLVSGGCDQQASTFKMKE